jgi:hypothetical protein
MSTKQPLVKQEVNSAEKQPQHLTRHNDNPPIGKRRRTVQSQPCAMLGLSVGYATLLTQAKLSFDASRPTTVAMHMHCQQGPAVRAAKRCRHSSHMHGHKQYQQTLLSNHTS